MDILNFISWIASKRRVVTSAPDDALLPIGIRTETRDDKYTTVAIKKSDLITVPEPTYKVYTALLTQSGGSNTTGISSGPLTKGVTYKIQLPGGDFSNVGAPNNDPDTYFVAINNDTPLSYGGNALLYNTGAPVVTVLENTIGNIVWSYSSAGNYLATLAGAFTSQKTFFYVSSQASYNTGGQIYGQDIRTLTRITDGIVNLNQTNLTFTAGVFSSAGSVNDFANLYLEIRVYN